MPNLTDEQVQAYVAGGGGQCPYCGSDDIVGASFDTGNEKVYQNIVCQGCGGEWTDEYTLTGVQGLETVEEPTNA